MSKVIVGTIAPGSIVEGKSRSERICEVLKLLGMSDSDISTTYLQSKEFGQPENTSFVTKDKDGQITIFDDVPERCMKIKSVYSWKQNEDSEGDFLVFLPNDFDKRLGFDLGYDEIYILTDMKLPSYIIKVNDEEK